MKRKLLLWVQLAVLVCLAACVMADKPDWQQTVPGTYATTYEQLYSNGLDTLRIEKKGHQKGLYRIIRHTTYRQQINGSPTSIVHKQEAWTATAEEDRQTLYLFPSGRRYWYDPETETLHAGEVIYKKIL